MKILISIEDQRASILDSTDKVVRVYPISTSGFGVGCDKDSNKTPIGNFRIHKKIGHDTQEGTVFRARIATGEVCTENPRSPLWQSTEDLVLSRILWLEGCDPQNNNTIDRFIYLHGTNQEHLIGKPVSHGCIRFLSKDIIDLFERVEVGTEIMIIG